MSPGTVWPESVEQAIEFLRRLLTSAQRDRLAALPEQGLVLEHDGLAMTIREAFGFWAGNKALLRNCGREMGYLGVREDDLPHPDDASMYLLRRLWLRLRDADSSTAYPRLH